MRKHSPRIVVTGAGVLLPTGGSVESLWQSALSGTSGITPYVSEIHRSSWLKYYGRVDAAACEAARKTIPAKLKRLCSESTVWGVAAAEQALAQAGLGRDAEQPARRGLFAAEQCNLYPGVHPFKEWLGRIDKDEAFDLSKFTQEALNSRALPFVFLKSLRNNLLSVASSLFQCKGDCGAFGQDEGAAVAALRSALFSLRHGYCDQALVVATGSSDEAWTLCELYADRYLSESADGARAFRPYDKSRAGMLLGEGAVALVLESEDSAARRGVEPLGGILAVSSQVLSPIERRRADSTKPYAACLARALRDSLADPYAIGAVCANGKGIHQSDLYELRNIEQALGPRAADVPVTCSTPLTGVLGTVGALADVLLSLLIVRHGLVPPIAHLEDPEITALALCRDGPVSHAGRHALAFNMGLTGFHSATLVGGF